MQNYFMNLIIIFILAQSILQPQHKDNLPTMQYLVPVSMAIMALIGAQTGMFSGLTNDILVNHFANSSPNHNNHVECGTYAENDLPPECKVGYSKTLTALTYGSLVKEAFSIIGGLLTSQLTPILGSRLLIIISIVITTLGPISLLWMLNNSSISPYLYIIAKSAVGIIKIIPIIFANLSKSNPTKNKQALSP
jgi:hypothetical protein